MTSALEFVASDEPDDARGGRLVDRDRRPARDLVAFLEAGVNVVSSGPVVL